jgi:hypothetical protein
VGIISLSMGQIIDRIRFAYRVGIRHFQISHPSWGALNDEDRKLSTWFIATRRFSALKSSDLQNLCNLE